MSFLDQVFFSDGTSPDGCEQLVDRLRTAGQLGQVCGRPRPDILWAFPVDEVSLRSLSRPSGGVWYCACVIESTFDAWSSEKVAFGVFVFSLKRYLCAKASWDRNWNRSYRWNADIYRYFGVRTVKSFVMITCLKRTTCPRRPPTEN